MSDRPVAVLTGASRGIGEAIALRLAEEGWNLTLISRSIDKASALLESLARPEEHLLLAADVSLFSEAERCIAESVKRFGRLDGLINNAGITKDNLLIRMSEEEWNSVLSVNLQGAFNFVRHALPVMVRQRRGRIVNIGSIVGLMGGVGQINYSASKAGLVGLTKSLAREYGSKGITANLVAPGFIETAMTDVLSEERKKEYLSGIPLRRFGTPEDIAGVVSFLLSPEASYVTGDVINVSGGLYM
ncbi:MAG TPA: 3-oxoacyl-[acyl-carrier-protein] reductase [Candidatus Aminicenantes bacterium]|nr:3-oxoacyl-[acyl-carrier-protein] reductase [Candidatus Aminicenantes bacterium]